MDFHQQPRAGTELYLQQPKSQAKEIAGHVGVPERTTHKIISDLEAAGYIERRKSGRKNLYRVDPALPLRHHTKQDIIIEDLLQVLTPP